ncbi:hypothetical protein F5050DRAFT_461047 [Lentinula boryana]|uniref:Uncharacterized protein n=1 Tax=Lentinula boryana TaxID=40481 RepID=A0ABQ8Q7S9_9AGAR|nr:hypothetical protein F5050DRAFT_461047 [Lentinula boryana]
MAHIGSVFLGDSRRQRVLSSSSSSSTPPSSPLPISPLPSATQTTFGMALDSSVNPVSPTTVEEADGIDEVEESKQTTASTSNSMEPARADKNESSLPSFSYIQSLGELIDPLTALELRVRLLEGLVVGLDGPSEEGRTAGSTTLVKSTETLKRTLDRYVDDNDTLRKFMNNYDQYAPYLTPAFALGLLDDSACASFHASQNPHLFMCHLSSLSSPVSSLDTLQSYIHEMEPEIRSADTSMQEIETLLRRGILDGEGANDKLESYIPLKPRLSTLLELHEQNTARADELERRVAGIMESHTGYIDTLSDLFLAWDDALTDAENRLVRIEREKEERERLGLA